MASMPPRLTVACLSPTTLTASLAAAADPPDFAVKLETAMKHDDGIFLWSPFHDSRRCRWILGRPRPAPRTGLGTPARRRHRQRSRRHSWLGRFMKDSRAREVEGATCVARILWSKPNSPPPP